MQVKRLTACAVLAATALVLSYIERFIPLELIIPLPGIKLGLANSVMLFVLFYLDGKAMLNIFVLRLLGGFLFGSNAAAVFFSLLGGLLSALIMMTVKDFKFISIYGISVLGAAAHSLGQIIAAYILMHSEYVFAYLPYLLLISIICGLITAFIAGSVLKRLNNKRLQV